MQIRGCQCQYPPPNPEATKHCGQLGTFYECLRCKILDYKFWMFATKSSRQITGLNESDGVVDTWSSVSVGCWYFCIIIYKRCRRPTSSFWCCFISSSCCQMSWWRPTSTSCVIASLSPNSARGMAPNRPASIEAIWNRATSLSWYSVSPQGIKACRQPTIIIMRCLLVRQTSLKFGTQCVAACSSLTTQIYPHNQQNHGFQEKKMKTLLFTKFYDVARHRAFYFVTYLILYLSVGSSAAAVSYCCLLLLIYYHYMPRPAIH